MRKVLGCLVVLLALGFSVEVMDFEDNWASNPLFNVVHETPFGLELVFSTQQVVIEEQEIDGVMMKSFGVPGVFIAEPGAPNLGGLSRYVALPQGARVQVVVLDVRTEVYHNVEVAPASNIPLDSDDKPLFYQKDMSIYGRNAYWPQSPIQLSAPLKMRGVDVVLVGVMPFQYNPVTKELVVYKDIRFRLDFVGGTGHFGEDRLRSRFWEPILQGHLLNYASLPKIDFYAPERFADQSGFEYIIIVPDDALFEQWADTIKAWRKLQGISCEVYNLTEIGGTSATAIENFLNTAYNTWSVPPVAFLILSDYPSSGDVYGVTSPIVDGYASDNKYADVDGDTLPDMFHARIAAQTATHLDRMVNKFLSYERSPYTAANYYNEPLISCGYQTERWFQLCSETVREFMINAFGKSPARQYNIYAGTPVVGGPWSSRQGTAPVVQYWYNLGWLPSLTNPYDAAWWNNGSPAGITGAINSGCFVLQHRDHGYEGGWGEPAYGLADLDNLTNTMYTYVYSINCLTGKYQNASEVFCEKFHRIVYGALGFNAPTEVSYSFVNDTYIWGTYDALWPQFDPGYPFFDMTGYQNLRPGMAMVSAKYYLFASWMPDSAGLGMTYKVTTAQLFHDHGDVFWTMYSVIPMTLTVSHAAALLAGQTSFTVTANDSSVIALTVNGEIIGVAEGTGGAVPITIIPQTPGNTMKVTVTKANYYRYEVDVPVTSSSYPYVTLSGTLIDDNAGGNNDGIVNPGESINYGIYGKNVGTGTALSVYGLLFESDTYTTLTTDSSWFGNIPEDDSSLSNPYYGFAVGTNCPNGHVINFTLDFHDVNDSIFTSYPSVTVYAPVLAFVDVSVQNDGNGNGILDPGEDADLVVTLENEGGATAASITSTLSTSSPYITINDASGNFGSIDPGNQGDNSSDPYNVTASGTTPTGTICNFEVEVVSGIYVDTFDFSIVVGKKHYYLWDPDPVAGSGHIMDSILTALGYSGDYGTALAADLTMYQACLVATGVYPDRYLFSSGSAQATQLVDFLQNDGGRVYIEGSATWYIDPYFFSGYDFRSVFGMTATAYSYNDMGPVVGETGTFTTGMNFAYGGQNAYMDHLNASGTGFVVFHDGNNSYNCGVANDASTYRTCGVSFELGGLTDASPPSTRSALLDSIMKFFGIIIPGVKEEGGLVNIPLRTMLGAMYPNPGVRVMSIRYQVATASDVSLCVYDAAGRLVRTVVSGKCEPGYYTMIWDTKDDADRAVPAGVYFIRFEADDYQRVEKAILLR